MSRIAILGCTGQLGGMVSKEFAENGYHVIGLCRDVRKALATERFYDFEFSNVFPFDAKKFDDGRPTEEFFRGVAKYLSDPQWDWLINCAGIIKPEAMKDVQLTYAVNGVLPKAASSINPRRFIHIATDCVFSGMSNKGEYYEDTARDASDVYGMSKSFGDTNQSLTLRTSIIGPEAVNHRSLISWFIKQAKRDPSKIQGYTNHLWNGITTKQLAKVLHTIVGIEVDRPNCGIRHVFSNVISKHQMLESFRDTLGLDFEIKQSHQPKPVIRILKTRFPEFLKSFEIPDFNSMMLDTKAELEKAYSCV